MDELSKALVEEDVCPKCLGELDTGWECNDCDYDARPLIDLEQEKQHANK